MYKMRTWVTTNSVKSLRKCIVLTLNNFNCIKYIYDRKAIVIKKFYFRQSNKNMGK